VFYYVQLHIDGVYVSKHQSVDVIG